MNDEMTKKIKEARAKIFSDLHPYGGKVVILSKGDVKISSPDQNTEVKKVE